LQWTAQSRQDVDDIYDYIGRRDRRPATEDKVVRELLDECRFLADAQAAGSMLGMQRDDLAESARLFTHKRWVIVFRPIENGIEVMRVIDGSRNLPRIFGEPG
jgi:toxin ParE1/3/4